MVDKSLPQHIAIIMDGNGRWAQKRFLPRMFGHKNGVEVVRRMVKHCAMRHIDYLTLYAFSSENWSRPAEEVDFLMGLFKSYLEKEIDFLLENNVRLRFIGSHQKLSEKILSLMQEGQEATKQCDGLNLTLAVNYGAHDEILTAISKTVDKFKSLDHTDNIQDVFMQNLMTVDIPDPDLLIRTAGEKRISNFLLWQIAYSELYFTDILWPDFTEDELDKALEDYARRERKYGGVSDGQ